MEPYPGLAWDLIVITRPPLPSAGRLRCAWGEINGFAAGGSAAGYLNLVPVHRRHRRHARTTHSRATSESRQPSPTPYLNSNENDDSIEIAKASALLAKCW